MVVPTGTTTLLVDPMVNRYAGIEEMLDTMIGYQERWLGYLK